MHTENDRLHALDAVRAIALLLGIVLHATMSFMMPLPILDNSQSSTLSVLFYVIHMFRMGAFYLIAGLFARMLIQRKGVKAFAKDRWRRIIIPMAGSWPILLLLLVPTILWGVSKTFLEGAPEGYEQENAFPLFHLWFLYYLCWFYIVALAARWCVHGFIDRNGVIRRVIDSVLRILINSYFAPVILAIPLFPVLYYNVDWMVWGGIPTPDQGLTPHLPAMIGFGMTFCIGWFVHRQMDLLQQWRKRWIGHLIIAVVLTVTCLAIVGVKFEVLNLEAATVVPGPDWMRLVYTACYTMATWYWSFVLIGVCMTYFSSSNKTWRYLADSSYWMYLAHLPIIFFLQVMFADLDMHWSTKFVAILVITVYILLKTYAKWVRGTWIGALLNGRRRPPLTES